MKHDTFEKYSQADMELAISGLLTTWDCLARYQEDLVLVGGLAVKLLTNPPESGQPGPVTLDVDFGVCIGTSDGMYGSIRETLAAHGFVWDAEKKRFLRDFDGTPLYIDLLTDAGKAATGTVVVDDGLPVGIVPGINRALQKSKMIEMRGKSLVGAESTQTIRVAEVGPMLALKLNAFGGPVGRKAPKDAHDILYLAMNYQEGGAERAIARFHEEKAEANTAMPFAIGALERYYTDENSEGPLACAAFRLDNRHLDPELQEESLQIRQQCVTLARALLVV
jgi:predicted nucleotidyltransferase